MAGIGLLGTSRAPKAAAEVIRTQSDELNWILRSVDAAEYARLLPHLERVTLKTLEVLAETGGKLEYVFFPGSAIISAVRPIDRTLVEAGTIGCEGMAGLGSLLGASWTSSKLLGEIPGSCSRVDFAEFAELLPELPDMRARLGRFTLSYIDQVGQTVACNARHTVDQRCARWLLLTRDRVRGDTIRLTHVVLAQMLGVRRASVTEAAISLQDAKLIRYSRGHITILDRKGLERLACECYRITRTNLARLLGEDALPGS